jgi:hypothetical protein
LRGRDRPLHVSNILERRSTAQHRDSNRDSHPPRLLRTETPDSWKQAPTDCYTTAIPPCCSHTPPARRSNACPELGETFPPPRVWQHCRRTTEAPPPPRVRPLPNAMSPRRLPCSLRPLLPHRPPRPAPCPAQHSTVKTRSRNLFSHTASPSWTTALSARTVARSSTR